MSNTFQLDQLIRLKNLCNESYNGKLAKLGLFPTAELCCNGRHRVELIDEVAPPLLQELSVKPENMEHACQRCHNGGESLLYCGKCRHARYCDGECQRLDWKRHKKECGSCGSARDVSKNPLILAIMGGDLERLRMLVQEGIDVDMTSNITNTTALHTAAVFGRFPIVQYLLQQGADMNKANNEGCSPLYAAAQEGHLTVLQYLLDHGADKDKADNNGASPLYIAAQKGHLPVLQCLMEHGADVNKTIDNGASPLFVAAENGHLPVVQYLLEQGADKDKAVNNGMSPLFAVAHFGYTEILSCLMRSGASLTVRDSNGNVPIDMAANEEIKQLMRDEEERRRTQVSTER